MSFFHNLNKTLDSIAAKPEAAQLNERDMSRAAKGYEKYGKEGMQALAKAGREGKALDPVRAKYDKYDDKPVDEGLGDMARKVGGMVKKAGGKVLDKLGHGDDAEMMRDLQRKMGAKGAQVHGKKGMAEPKEGNESGGSQPAVQIFNDYDEVVMEFDKLPPRLNAALQGSDFGAVQWLADLSKHDEDIDMSTIEKMVFSNGHVIEVQQFIDGLDEGNEFSGELQQARASGQKEFSVDGKTYPVKETEMTPKQKSFAKLAPPKDKITFADKIAGAKKEVDEMLGDVAAEAMRNALGGRQQVADEGNAFTGALAKTPKGGKFKVGGKEFTDTSSVDEDDDKNPFTNWKKPSRDTPRVGDVTHGAKHDTKHTATGRVVTRRVDAQGNSVGSETDAEGNTIDKRGRGRPKGPEKGPERTTAKAYKHKGERKVKEGDMEEGADQGQAQQIYNDLADIRAIAKQAQHGGEFPQGYASRLESVLYAAMTMIKNQQPGDAQVREAESTTKKDNHAERAGKKVAKDIEYDEKKKDGIHGKKRGAEDGKAEKAGKKVAKDIEHDEKKDDEKEDAPKKSKGKFKFGGSVYETLDTQLETLITEGMSVTVNMSNNSEDGQDRKNITVNADGEDADRLAELLQMAGLSQQSNSCSSCGSSPCGCDMIDENNPNWPTDTETSDNALQYAGGLNGPKSTGQATTPVLASQLRRQASMAESARVEQNLLNLYKTFGK